MGKRNDEFAELQGVPVSLQPSLLLLADGSTFEGEAIGAELPVASGEVVFHTGLKIGRAHV